MSTEISTSILAIRTDHAAAIQGLADVERRGAQLSKSMQSVGKQMSTSFTDFSGVAKSAGAALAGAFAVTSIVAAGKSFIDYAGSVSDLAQRLGASTTAVQHWQSAFGAAGVEIGTVAKASNVLAEKLTNGDKSAVGALKAMGLSLAQLKTLGPEEQFNKVADAVGKLSDQGERVVAAKSLFGKGGVELLSALDGHLQDTIKHFDDLGMTIDERTIKAADDFGDQLGAMGKQLMAVTASIVGPLLPALSALGNSLMWIGQNIIGPVLVTTIENCTAAFNVLWLAVTKFLSGLIGLAQHVPIVGKYLDGLSGAQQWLQEQSAASTKRLQDWVTGADKVGTVAATTAPKVVGLGKAADDAGEGMKKWQAAVESLSGVHDHWYQTLQTVDGTVVEGIKYYLERGVSAEKLAEAYKVTAAAVDAVVESLKIENTLRENTLKLYAEQTTRLGQLVKAQLDANNKGALGNLTTAAAAFKNAEDLRNKAALSSYEYQKTLIERDLADKIAALDRTREGYQDALEAIAQETDARMLEAQTAWEDHLADMNVATGSWGEFFRNTIGQIPNLLKSAFTGGGDIKGALKGLMSQAGSALFGENGPLGFAAGGMLNGLGNKLTKMFGSAVGLALPGIGSALGALIGPLAEKLGGLLKRAFGFGGPSKDELEGREVVEKFEGGFKNVKDMIDSVGAAYIANGKTAAEAQAAVQRMWDAEKQGAEAVKVAIEAINAELAHAKEVDDAIAGLGIKSADELQHAADIAREAYEKVAAGIATGQFSAGDAAKAYRAYQEAIAAMGGAAGAAAQAWLDAQAAAEGGAKKVSAAMQALLDQKKSLEDSYANEAPEEFMGSIEKAARDQVDIINKQIDDMQRQAKDTAEAAAEAAKRVGESTGDAADSIYNDMGIDASKIILETADLMKESFGDASGSMKGSMAEVPPEAQRMKDAIDRILDNLDYEVKVRFKIEDGPEDPTRHRDDLLDDPTRRRTFTMRPALGPTFRPASVPVAALTVSPFGSQRFAGATEVRTPTVVHLGGVHVHPPSGTSLADMNKFAPAFVEGLRTNIGGMYSAVEIVAQRATARKVGTP